MSSANGNEPNALVHSTSPYLLQHAYNPVHWHPWGKEAFAQAKAQDKPILVSIGYSACHWCHVMERESFEDQAVADYMNLHFISIKVDREEHPDVDHMYMNACQLMTGAGGWPLNMFLTPDLKPFTGGTYYPPEARYGRTSWLDALTYVVDIWNNRKEEVLAQGNQVAEQISRTNLRMLSMAIPEGKKEGPEAGLVAEKLAASFDTVNGGFGDAPKFPSSMTLLYMLRSSWFTKDEKISDQVPLTLQHMLHGGIYDHIAGGISRYTVDAAWMVPHFEKMLYDNALLVTLLAEAYGRYQLPEYKQKMEETISFVLEEMMSEEGGFYAAYDADSEGVEGKYYTWSQEEVMVVLGEEADWFMGMMDIRKEGNWEGRNILHMNHPGAVLPVDKHRLQNCLSLLKKVRSQRVKPQLDDKVIVFWNALMSEGLIKAYMVTGNEAYLEIAKSNIDFILEAFMQDNQLLHVRTKGQSHIAANLEDYAALIQVLISIFSETGDIQYWERALGLLQQTELRFRDKENGFFRFGDRSENHLPVDTIELFDHAVPSGNAIMAMNYHRIYTVTGVKTCLNAFEIMAAAMTPAIRKYPSSFGYWLNALLPLQFEQAEIVVSGPDAKHTMRSIHQLWHPMKFSMIICDRTLENLALSGDRYNENVTSIYLCRNQQCAAPVKQVSEFKEQLFGL